MKHRLRLDEMGTNVLEKIRILMIAIRIIKNWYLYVFIYFKFVKTENPILETRSGIKVMLRVNSTDLMAFTHVWLLGEYNKPGFEINDNDIIIDIGAHIGLFALFASQFCKNGKVYCFEPVKENFDLLLSNLRLNKINNVKPYNIAVSNQVGSVTIYLNEDEAGHSMHITGIKSIRVESDSLKNIIDSNKLEKCDLVKMDCEGEEYNIINLLPPDYFNKINKLCIEYHFADNKPHLVENLIKKLKTLSYDISSRRISESIGFIYAQKGES